MIQLEKAWQLHSAGHYLEAQAIFDELNGGKRNHGIPPYEFRCLTNQRAFMNTTKKVSMCQFCGKEVESGYH